MKIFNTLHNKKETFAPLNSPRVTMYLCGPTVYDLGHLGHARSAIAFDIIRKYLKFRGYQVTYISNYTDIDDKMINRARELNISVPELAERLIPEYQKDYAALNIEPADYTPRATEHIPTIIKIIQKLLQKGFAYETADGIFFKVNSFPNYGKLSKQKLSQLEAGARVDINENKLSPHDFALWKKEKPGEPSWESPFGRGRPGWHIECSAMNFDLLGPTIDIHAGGQDLIFPHHEDEIAQSEAANQTQFVRYWLHNGFIRINQEKMSKSLGNFFTIQDVLKKYPARVVRFFLMQTHYRSPIDFSEKLLGQAKNSLQRLDDFVLYLQKNISGTTLKKLPTQSKIAKLIANTKREFIKGMNNDFEITHALAALFELIKKIYIIRDKKPLSEVESEATLNLLKEFNQIFSIFNFENINLPPEIAILIEKRQTARHQKDFALADSIRNEIRTLGYELEDSKEGVVWKKI